MKKNHQILSNRNKLATFYILGVIILAGLISLMIKFSSFSSLTYWGVLGLYIITILYSKFSSDVVLWFSLILFLLAGLLTTFGVSSLAENLMRLSLIGWLTGFIQSFFEYFFTKKH